ncbi:MAG: alpha/beta hydrolase [Spirochaetia bacterium]
MTEWSSTLTADIPVKTVPVKTGGERLLAFDLYIPRHVPAPPLLVYLHGGGWHSGHNDRPPAYRSILKRGFALASLQYRFSTEAPWREMLDDIRDGIIASREYAAEEGCGTDDWFLWGISAGGHLASLYAHRASGNGPEVPNGVVSWCGVFDLPYYAALEGVHSRYRDTVTRIVGELSAGKEGELRDLSPIFYAGRNSVPHYFIHGEDDDLVPPEQSRRMHRKLTESGVKTGISVIPGRDHAMPPDDSEEIHRSLDFLESIGGPNDR